MFTRNSRIMLIIAMALIAMFVLVACGGATPTTAPPTSAPPAPTSAPPPTQAAVAPTSAPAPTQPPAAPTSAPAPTQPPAPTSAPVAAVGKWCSNVHIVFFPGGPSGRRLCGQRLQRRCPSPERPGPEGGLCLVQLGSPDDDPAVPRISSDEARWHCRHGTPRRRIVRLAD